MPLMTRKYSDTLGVTLLKAIVRHVRNQHFRTAVPAFGIASGIVANRRSPAGSDVRGSADPRWEQEGHSG